MVQSPPEILVQPDAYRVTREPLLLVSELQAALEALADSKPAPEPALRNLAPQLDLAPLVAP